MPIKKICVIFNRAPYASSSVIEGIRLASGVTAADIAPLALFTGDGVYALKKDQNPAPAGLEPLRGAIGFLTMNDIPIYVARDALDARGLRPEDLLPLEGLNIIGPHEIAQTLLQCGAVFSI